MRDREITVAEACALFGVPRWQMYRWIRDFDLVAVNTADSAGCKGRVTFYRLSDVAELVADRHAERSSTTSV